MGTIDRTPHGAAQQATGASVPTVPQPRSSPDTRRHAQPLAQVQDQDARLGGFTDFAHLYSRLSHVAMWTGAEGATFLLRTMDGCWYTIERDSPEGARLLMYLGQLPGLDTISLRQLKDRPDQSPGTVTLWPASLNDVAQPATANSRYLTAP